MTAGARDASAAGADQPAGPWGRAIEVPGLGALNKRNAKVTSVSCGSSGNCVAGGFYYAGGSVHRQGFVAVERNGVWRRAIEVPGLGGLNTGGNSKVTSVSCGPAGTCAVGGLYFADRPAIEHGFAAVERNGRWRKAVEVPGRGVLNSGGDGQVDSVSCGAAGTCAVGGLYYSGNPVTFQGFVAVERNRRWRKAVGVPGLGALNRGGDAEVDSVSCASAGSCAAGGDYTDRRESIQGFVAAERNGRWRKAVGVPGLGALNRGRLAEVDSVSCASAGSCAAGGDYTDRRGNSLGFVAVERNGQWGQAVGVPGLEALNTGGFAEVVSVSCPSAGNCAAGGDYMDRRGNNQGFVVVERNGRWGQAVEVPGLGALNKEIADVRSVSCASPGNCAAGGDYTDGRGASQGFLVLERNGRWGQAVEVPRLGALNTTDADVRSVSCAPEGTCAAGGYYTDRRDHLQGFVVSQTG